MSKRRSPPGMICSQLTSPAFSQLNTTPAFVPATPPTWCSPAAVPEKRQPVTVPLFFPTTPPTSCTPRTSPVKLQSRSVPSLKPTTPPISVWVPVGQTAPSTFRSCTLPFGPT